MLGCALASLVPLMRRTGIAVAVVGIDNPAQVQWWHNTGADTARGTAFAPPVSQQAIPGLAHSRAGQRQQVLGLDPYRAAIR